MSGTVAAIDCGTNSTRLLVCDGEGRTLARRMRITRLGEGVDRTGLLLAEAMQRTAAVLREYREMLERLDASAVRVIATSAARDAANRDDFFDLAEAAAGTRPGLLTGEEEGRLSFLGATRELDAARGPFLVADLGGGSTELVFGTEEVEAVRSLDVGCVRVTEKFLHHDPPAPDELADALGDVRDRLEDVVVDVPAIRDAALMVGLAGTVSTVAAVEIGLPEYDRDRIHHFWLSRAAIEDVFRTLATESRADRVHNPGLEPERADVIVGGCVVLVSLVRFFDLDGCLVSESDILDGLAMTMLKPH